MLSLYLIGSIIIFNRTLFNRINPRPSAPSSTVSSLASVHEEPHAVDLELKSPLIHQGTGGATTRTLLDPIQSSLEPSKRNTRQHINSNHGHGPSVNRDSRNEHGGELFVWRYVMAANPEESTQYRCPIHVPWRYSIVAPRLCHCAIMLLQDIDKQVLRLAGVIEIRLQYTYGLTRHCRY